MSSRTLAGRYELLERIGDGGMAVVYKSRDRLLNRYVAVKILKPEFTKDIKFIESFRRESQSAASLSHPNIVGIYDVGKEGNINYIVMELVEGKVLSDIIKETGPLPVEQAIFIAEQIASGLSVAHANNIIHRDIKPHNIMLTKDGVAKITDFGIAKAVNSATIVGNTGMVMGSVHYFSPEQARGGYVDEKSDIYSLGIVLYEMLTGRVPFDADNPVAVAVMHMNDEIKPPSEIVPDIPKEVEDVVLKATDKFQINRYHTANEMNDALEKALNAGMNDLFPPKQSSGSKGLDATMMMSAINKEEFDSVEEMLLHSMNKDKENDVDIDIEADRQKNSSSKKSKFKFNKIKVAAVVVALICAIPVSQLVLFGFNALGTKTVEVPDIRGLTYERAEEELEKYGLKIKEGTAVLSSEYGEGQVVTQDPIAGKSVKSGQTVTVSLNRAAAPDSVPDVVGKTIDSARIVLSSAGFELDGNGISEDYSDDYPAGVIISQDPKYGAEVEKGTKVSVVVSLGKSKSEVTVPSFIGMTLDEAKDEISKLKLSVKNNPVHDDAPVNQVINQSPAEGSSVEEGATITLTYSLGPEESSTTDPEQPPVETGPSSVDIPISFDKAETEVFYMTVTVTDGTGKTTTQYENHECFKSNGRTVITVKGEGKGTVTIYFDGTPAHSYAVDFDNKTY